GESAHCPIKDAELSIDDPLEGWRLRLTLAPGARRLASGQTMRWVSVMAALGSSAALVLLGVLITLNLNRQLRLAAEQVSFVNQVSHELRTPLTNIRMYTDLALQGLETHPDAGLEPEIERLSIIQQESSRLGRLIENVLSFARMGRIDRSLQVQEVVDLDAVIDQVVATFAPPLNELGIQVDRERGVNQTVSVNLEIVEQILVNLISNAIKYASAGKLLRLQSQLSGSDLLIRVIDAGPGIPKRLRRRVFEPFFRLSNRLEDPAGTGIGLSIARELARQHGGDCVLENTQVGCSFLVRLRTEHRASGHG
ncbi:MAG: HAMP domain-containing histidine kinase, partial [Pirellulaceae bacterium]|nr:HAMP domain-containing histidine kinase [Pirellulaceae bacterium]